MILSIGVLVTISEEGTSNSKSTVLYSIHINLVQTLVVTLIDPIFGTLNQNINSGRSLAWKILCHEQTVGFTGKYSKKSWVKYKKVGDSYQEDSLCVNGYMYSFYFCHQSAQKKI